MYVCMYMYVYTYDVDLEDDVVHASGLHNERYVCDSAICTHFSHVHA